MKEVRTSIDIHASSASVWQALTDFFSYREWLVDAPKITGKLEEGNSLEFSIGVTGAASRNCKLLLRKVDVERELCWSLNTFAPKLFGSERRFVIKVSDADKVEFIQSEVFWSLASALSAFVSYRSIRQAMEQMNRALKDRAEHLQKQLAVETADTTVWPPPFRKGLT